jgi:hypothetical protein
MQPQCLIDAWRATLSQHEEIARAAAGVAPIPRGDDGEPVFREPWEAQAFAMTLALYEQGLLPGRSGPERSRPRLSAPRRQEIATTARLTISTG